MASEGSRIFAPGLLDGQGLRGLRGRHRARPRDARSSSRGWVRPWSAAAAGAEPLDGDGRRGRAARRGAAEAVAMDIRDDAGGRRAVRRGARAPRPGRRARQQRRRPVPEPGRGDLAEGLSHRDRAQRRRHLADDPRRGDQGVHPAGRRQGAERHPLAPQRDAGDGPLGRRAGGGREHDADALGRVGAVRDPRSARSPPASSTPRRCGPSTRRRWSRRCRGRSRSAASGPRRRWPG